MSRNVGFLGGGLRMLCHFRAAIFAILFVPIWASESSAGPEEGLFKAAKIIYETAQEQPADQKYNSYQRVRDILDRIALDYGASDLAVRILLQDTIDGVDVKELDAFLQDHSSAQTSVEPETSTGLEEIPEAPDETVFSAANPSSENAPKTIQGETTLTQNRYAPANVDTEKALGFEKKDIRDLQARLLVSGYDPNGVDGAIGKGTRSAIRSWQASIGAVETGYMSADLLALLKESSQAGLTAWLQESTNARKYEPPPPIAIGPGNLPGRWSYVTNCGKNSKFRQKMRITGTLSMKHAGGRNYSGTLSNSQGFRGRVSATLRGRSVSAVTNFGLLIGKVSLKARVDDHQLVLRGRDSNGCSFYASK